MVLNHDSHIVLKRLNKLNFRFDGIDDFSAMFHNKSLSDIENALIYLDKCGYIKCRIGDDTVLAVSPTYEGLKYSQFKWAEFKYFMLRSILTPIAVSFFTTLIISLFT